MAQPNSMTRLFVRGQSWTEAAARGERTAEAAACQVGNTKEGRGSHGFFHPVLALRLRVGLTRLTLFTRLPPFASASRLSASVLCTSKTLLHYLPTASFSFLHDIVICDVCVAVPQSPEEP
jgi:hypothetical protein